MSVEPSLDSIVLAVISKFKARAAMGKQKYGTDLDRTDLQPLDWIQHAQEELMDGILYLEKLKQTLVISGKDHLPQMNQVKEGEKKMTYEEIQQRHGC
jgi:hypothetical protein